MSKQTYTESHSVYLSSAEETIKFAEALSKTFYPNLVVALYGPLGAGKTTFVKGILKGLDSIDLVQSPTYSLLHIYEGSIPVYHFDLYRLKNASEFVSLGFEEYFEEGGVCLIEWAERIESILPLKHKRISLEMSLSGRLVTLWD